MSSGFSAHGSVEVIRRFLDAYGEQMEFCQLQLNYMDWHFQGAEEKVKLIWEAGDPHLGYGAAARRQAGEGNRCGYSEAPGNAPG